jgi:hypothetical protein
MSMLHVKKGLPAHLALPEKGELKNGICLDFCSQERKCTKPHQACKNGKHYMLDIITAYGILHICSK